MEDKHGVVSEELYWADDIDHAREQVENAHPDVKIHIIEGYVDFAWKPFEDAARERLESIQKTYDSRNWTQVPDTIEDISLDWDEGGLYMTIEGDFVYSMLKYLINNDEKDGMYNKITLKVDGYCVDKMKKELA
jgi:hypothetical protein